MRKVSIAIPTYERATMLLESFAYVIQDERVSEICIVDDASDINLFVGLSDFLRGFPKVKLYRNQTNLDCYANKREAASKTTGEWVIIFDSDNILTPSYLDAIYEIPEWNPKTIYQPTFAKPCFNFQEWNGLTITKENVAAYADTHLMTSLNAFNLFINREEYLKVWDGTTNPGTSDSIYFSLCWLKAGNSIFMTPNLHYDHRIHPDKSNHYSTHSHKYVDFHEKVMQEIRQLK